MLLLLLILLFYYYYYHYHYYFYYYYNNNNYYYHYYWYNFNYYIHYFPGNLPNKISRDEVLRVVIKKLGKNVVTDLRLSLDENKRPRGFGYIELKDESMVEKAIEDLNGLDVGEN